MDDLELLIDLHTDMERQGPGGQAETRMALALSGLKPCSDLKIADIGCGSGASALLLAQKLDASVTAVDFAPAFVERLEDAARKAGLEERITAMIASMDALPFHHEEFDAIWSEGAAYNMGFEAAIRAWRPFLKPAGILAISELTWLSGRRPADLQAHWEREYPEVDTASAKIAILEKYGFSPLGYFVLPEHCWLDNYYRPLQRRFAAFVERHANCDQARALVDSQKAEITLYERNKAYVGYGFFIARKLMDQQGT